MDRGGVVRAGNKLLQAGVLYSEGNQIGVQQENSRWKSPRHATQEEQPMTRVSADKGQRKAMTVIITSDDACHRKRCLESALFRWAKDSSKDKLKTYKNRNPHVDAQHQTGAASNNERRPLVGAATPIPGKYDGISEN
jgi:hypothetical protein